jgi:predicted DCC family thiol-disulfide oxidoreductase YuxK
MRSAPDATLIVYYDETCGICMRIAAFLDRLNGLKRIRFLPALEHPTAGEEAYVDIISDRDDGRTFRGFSTYQQIVWRLPVLWLFLPLLYLPPVPLIGRWLYRRIADNRQCKLNP